MAVSLELNMNGVGHRLVHIKKSIVDPYAYL